MLWKYILMRRVLFGDDAIADQRTAKRARGFVFFLGFNIRNFWGYRGYERCFERGDIGF